MERSLRPEPRAQDPRCEHCLTAREVQKVKPHGRWIIMDPE